MSYKQDWIYWDQRTGKVKVDYKISSLRQFQEELLINATTIRESFTGQFDFFFSGGISSQVALYSFIKSKIPVNIFIGRFGTANQRDVETATSIVQSLNLNFKIIDLDIDNFFENEADKLFLNNVSFDVTKLLTAKLTTYSDNIPVIAGKEPYVFRPSYDYSDQKDWQVKFTEDDFYFEYFLKDRPAVSNWSMYSPELILALLEEPSIVDLLNNKFLKKFSIVSTRNTIFKEIYPQMIPRLAQTGLEQTEFPWLMPDSVINFFKEKVQESKQFREPNYFPVPKFIDLFKN